MLNTKDVGHEVQYSTFINLHHKWAIKFKICKTALKMFEILAWTNVNSFNLIKKGMARIPRYGVQNKISAKVMYLHTKMIEEKFVSKVDGNAIYWI